MAALEQYGSSVGASQEYPWYALWVRSRHEKSVAEILCGKGFETFLPLHASRRRWSDRIQEVELPLIPGYVFCRFDANHRLPILTTPGLVQIVSAGKTPQAVDEGEMQSLITAVRAGVHLQLWPFLKCGQRVSIEEGPLRSLEGVLITTKGADQLILSISLLQRSVAVTVDRRWVRPMQNETETSRRHPSFPVERERIPFGR
ncbi:MAG TPA: UpxY family transcription antiterminator [Bryobacteraceae bacterium]|nr:UpxY family transcription antiterminator [Bryobacteraceae bacterium]